MTWEDRLFDIFLALLPAVVVFITAYLMLKKFFEEKANKDLLELKRDVRKSVLPNRLQAFERMILFLERISPENLIMRVHKPGLNAQQFQHLLLQTIRSEYEHNMVQQVYLSANSWEKIKVAKEQVTKLVNLSIANIPNTADSVELSKKIFEMQDQLGGSPTVPAINTLKKEIKTLF